jgi:hypothetical protein
MIDIQISVLAHTWLIDIDGVLIKHNSHKFDGNELLTGVKEFWDKIPEHDIIILMSARTKDEEASTLNFFTLQKLRFDHSIFGLPVGERILINDTKPGGLITAMCFSIPRDQGLKNFFLKINAEI